MADEPHYQLSREVGREGTPIADNLLYLQQMGVVGLMSGPPGDDGSQWVHATFTSDGLEFVKDQFGEEVVLKTRIREKISRVLNLSAGELQRIRRAVELLPSGPHAYVGLRLVDLGLSGNAEARAATLEYLSKS